MKAITGIIIAIFILVACSSPEKLLQRGDYDALVDKSVKNLIKKPGSNEDAAMLDKAYKLANERDLDRVKYLKMENNPNTWDEMLNLYNRLKYRQDLVKRVMPLRIDGQVVQYTFTDYDAEMVAAKRKAAEYYNAHGRQLMANGNRESYRQAYYELIRAKEYSGDSYPDLGRLIEEARYQGMSRVLVSVENRTIINLPQEFTDGLVVINAADANSEWVEYYTRNMDNNVRYDYFIDIILQAISVSPDLSRDRDFIEKKRVEDGWEYVLDAKGNVMKDTAGNDIKKPKYKDIQCAVIETRQQKDCSITGEVEFSSANPEILLKKQPIAAGTHFEHLSARAIGDLNALSDETRKKVNAGGTLPFPNDLQMIFDCTEALKGSIYEAIRYNRGILQ